ncbi:hypothetical protein [Duganella lactea]|nr:hypothetical protein [Duganella lactea]
MLNNNDNNDDNDNNNDNDNNAPTGLGLVALRLQGGAQQHD